MPPLTPLQFKLKPWLRNPKAHWESTAPQILKITPATSKTGGGGTVTITGVNFRVQSDGTQPTITFGGVAGTGVSVTSLTTLTVVVPAATAAGAVDVVATFGSQVTTLFGGFLYYAPRIISVKPKFTSLSGGTVIISGANLSAAATFTFGGVAGTTPTYIDESHYSVVAPAKATGGFVDIVYTEGVITSTLKNGLQYVEVIRVNDIRRNPGITISERSGSAPNEAHFVIGGRSQEPVPGEDVAINDAFDANRLLFAGTLLDYDATFEGANPKQLVWNAHAVDWSYLMNRRRPFGSYTNVSVSEVVKDLMAKYAPGFDRATYVQTNLALVTISLDGTRTLGEVFDDLAQAIGGGRWYVDYLRKLHFFHPPILTDIVVPPDNPGGADFTAAVLTVGAAIGITTPFKIGYYAVRVTFLYSNSVESRLGPMSNVAAFDGTKFMHIASIPIGLNPSGGITCIGRKIYYLRGNDAIAAGWTINDNVTTSIDVYPNMQDTTTVTDNGGDPPTVPDNGSGGTTTTAPPPGNGKYGLAVSQGGPFSGSGHMLIIGGAIADGVHFTNCFFIATGLTYAFYRWKFSVVYSNGSESQPSQPSAPALTHGPVPIGTGGAPVSFTYSNGQSFITRGFDTWIPGAPDDGTNFPAIGNATPVKYRFYAGAWKIPAPGAGGGFIPGPSYIDDNAGYVLVGECPYFTSLTGSNNTPAAPGGGGPIDTTVTVPSDPPGYGDQPKINPENPTQTLIWPNPDGPYLENFSSPEDVTDLPACQALQIPAASQNPSQNIDISQLRNLVKVFGGGSSSVLDAAVGAFQIQMADVSVYSLNGGTLMAGNGVSISFFSTSSLPTGEFILLSQALSAPIPSGTPIQYYALAEDKASQLARGLVELDENGNPSDGIHEYVINDSSLTSAQQVYLRAHAEIAVYSSPIRTVRYSTRDKLSRVGANVHFNLTYPPIQGDFLIQSVEIDQIHDESDVLTPRYNVQASSLRYDLSNFLLTIAGVGVGGGQSGSLGSVASAGNAGVAAAAVEQAVAAIAATPTYIKTNIGFPLLSAPTSAPVFRSLNNDITVTNSSLQPKPGGGTQPTGKTNADGLYMLSGVGVLGGSNPCGSLGSWSSPGHNCYVRWQLRTPSIDEMSYSLLVGGVLSPVQQFAIGLGIAALSSLPTTNISNRGVYLIIDGNDATPAKRAMWQLRTLDDSGVVTTALPIPALQQDTVYDIIFEDMGNNLFNITINGTVYPATLTFRPGVDIIVVCSTVVSLSNSLNSLMWIKGIQAKSN